MNFTHIKPSPPLDQFIKTLWILEKVYSNTGDHEVVYPDGCIDLVFSFSGNNLTSFFTGQQTTTIKIPQSSAVKFVAVEFFPFGAFPFVHTPMKQFTGTVASPADIFGAPFRELEEKIFASSSAERIQVIENFLLQRLLAHKADGVVKQPKNAAQLLYAKKGNIRIDQLADAVNMTKRTLERKFETAIGLTPKALAKIFRFNKIKNELIRDPYSNLSSLAYQYHYFDQAHFIHDFQQCAGSSPATFAKGVMEKQIYFNRQ
jgi:AraC-like DNA-binding protein